MILAESGASFTLPSFVPRIVEYRIGEPDPVAVFTDARFQVSIVPISDLPRVSELTSISIEALDRLRVGMYEPPTAVLVCRVLEEVSASSSETKPADSNGPHLYSEPLSRSVLCALQLAYPETIQFERLFFASHGSLHPIVAEWLPSRHYGPKLSLDQNRFAEVIQLAMSLWHVDSLSRTVSTAALLDNALKFYQLALSRHEADLQVVLLSICFESLFRQPEAESNSGARRTLAKLICSRKSEYSEINAALEEDRNKKGALHYRNLIVHGKLHTDPLPDGLPHRFREYLRRAILAVIDFAESANFVMEDYYSAVQLFAETHYGELPT